MILENFRKVIKLVNKFCKKTYAAIAVETAIVLALVIMLILYIAELCTVIFISSAMDVAMSEAMLYSSATSKDGTYNDLFRERLLDRIKDTPLLYNKKSFDDDVDIEVRFCATIADITNERCVTDNSRKMPIAIYSARYKYTPLFLPLPADFLNNGLTRSMIYVQEKERVGR